MDNVSDFWPLLVTGRLKIYKHILKLLFLIFHIQRKDKNVENQKKTKQIKLNRKITLIKLGQSNKGYT